MTLDLNQLAYHQLSLVFFREGGHPDNAQEGGRFFQLSRQETFGEVDYWVKSEGLAVTAAGVTDGALWAELF